MGTLNYNAHVNLSVEDRALARGARRLTKHPSAAARSHARPKVRPAQ